MEEELRQRPEWGNRCVKNVQTEMKLLREGAGVCCEECKGIKSESRTKEGKKERSDKCL